METASMYERVLANLLADRKVWREIADKTRVPYSTIRKIASRYTKNPGVDKVEKLNSYFETQVGRST
jgi:predicted transcriptional regulator